MSSLGNDSSGSRIAPKPKKASRPRLEDREADSEGSANSTLMTRFSGLRLGRPRNVPKLCWRETAGENRGDLL